ncbi:MAG: hypothetical protein EAX96_13985 [Candidatus Lokiarchaeota archaeon]|nr:hypothetical protein [Candidatus Lokiarchaeota archaeon]
MSKFKKILFEKLENNIPRENLNALPNGFQQIGNKAIINLKPEVLTYQNEISNIILENFSAIKGVYLKKGGISGNFRVPDLEYIRGERDPIIQHKEHGIIFKFDMTKIMFAKGNINERLRFKKIVKEDEIIFDLFSGIGYFSLIIAKYCKPKIIYSFELNPVSFEFLTENIKLNKINDKRLIIRPIFGDSNQEMLKIKDKADRVIMGIIPAPKSHLSNVFKILNEDHGIIHYEGLLNDRMSPNILLNDVLKHANEVGRECKLLKANKVKSYGPKVNHVTLDIEIN